MWKSIVESRIGSKVKWSRDLESLEESKIWMKQYVVMTDTIGLEK